MDPATKQAIKAAAVAVAAENLYTNRYRMAALADASADTMVWENVAREIVTAVTPILSMLEPGR